MNRWLSGLTALLFLLAICVGSLRPAFAASGVSTGVSASIDAGDGDDTGRASLSWGTVDVSARSYFELTDVMLLEDKGRRNVSFTVTVHNGEASELFFLDYWVHLLTATGSDVPVRLLPSYKDKNRVAPRSTSDFGFYAVVDDTTKLADLVVRFIKWDFTQPNMERLLGELAAPATYTAVTGADSARLVDIDGMPVRTSVKSVSVSRSETYTNVTVVYGMTATGARSAAIPAYRFAIRTAEGYLYPLEVSAGKDDALDPNIERKLELTAAVPAAAGSEGWQLVVSSQITAIDLNLAVAAYWLPAASGSDGGQIGQEYTYTNKAGEYTVQVTSIHRLPWEDEDIVTSTIALSNRGSLPLPIPELTGFYYLDDTVKIDAKLVRTDQIIGLAPGASVLFQLVGQMPYTYDFAKVKLVLQEKEGGTSTTELLKVTNGADMLNVPYNNVGETFTVRHVGRSASYKVRGVRTYRGDTADTIMVMMEAGNLEKRYTGVTKLVAHFRAPDGSVFPAVVSEPANKVSPGGKALLFITATLPKTYPVSGMHILIGEAITEGKLTPKDGKPDAYMNASAFWLPEEDTSVKDSLTGIDLAPYTLSIDHIATQLKLSELKLTFNYELARPLLMETNTEGRKLIFSFEDENGNKTFTREFDFSDFEGKRPNDGTKDTKLRLGRTEGFELKEADQDLIFKLETLKTYKLSVYDSAGGHKKLLAAKKIDWFSTTD